MTSSVEAPPVAPPRERYGLELLAVLGVSLGMSAIYALLYFIRAELTVSGGIGNTTATVVQGTRTVYPVLDLLDDLAGILNGLAPPLLALVLLARNPGGRGFGIGFDLRNKLAELAQGAGFAILIGVPGLFLVFMAHQLGLNASLNVVSFPDVWYRDPFLVLSAFQNGFAEEVVVVGYMITRLRQLGWSDTRAIAASATLRGSYHLYQGFGGFAGNLIMGIIFGWWFTRTRRVLPLVVAHFLIDAASFLGYVYLHGRISWI
ncbi:MAG: Membrane protease YdiL, protease family [Pseudonocardiales bacterium]|nr:Membrane protease YdiL, protease family [Pseudonocardiales bacterium]